MQNRYGIILLTSCLYGLILPSAFGGGPAQAQKTDQGDIDAFMARVLENRDINWEELRHYVFREREKLEFKGMKIAAMESFVREYVWFVRDGYLIRSPIRANGVDVSQQEQAEYERDWLKKNKKKRRSIDREAFFVFKFTKGSFLFAGRREFEGRRVVAVEYYPTFSDLDNSQDQKGKQEEEYQSMFEKTLLVTMLILPEEHQIVKISFDTVGLEFLPYRWLVRLDELRASMTLDKPVGDMWLPKSIIATGSLTTANASLTVKYTREFFDYKRTDVKVRFWFETPDPRKPRKPEDR
jgi:hypothetical protein